MEVKTLRKRMNLSQQKFVAYLDVSFQTINRWEKGRSTPAQMAIKLIIITKFHSPRKRK
ncbi:helix-turn-helix domain-containing protein [Laspinema palackyanum]|uniref:helix-turn-helix domain-containing protein n=1 Tax=Laspinema palackyanum TaxID=3231601 RepID=UPI00349F669C